MTTPPEEPPHTPPPPEPPTHPPPPPPQPPAPEGEEPPPVPDAPTVGSRWSRLFRPAVLAVGVVLGAAVTGGCWLIVSLVGGESSTEKTFSTSGTLTLVDSSLSLLEEGEVCAGLDGYSDIHRGAQVNITGADGTLVAAGELGGGTKTALGCEFPFEIEGIPQDSKFYTVEVSHRGGLTRTEAELRSGELGFTLGND
ncbi:hypothetical protein ACIQ9E_21840 [Streptomyces sp. NPDC094448]|uniref:hypothetical protein n=1 Tax=Streptomyces sp. NPDC094448 TaxID=3366063 RepID=UPI00381E924B